MERYKRPESVHFFCKGFLLALNDPVNLHETTASYCEIRKTSDLKVMQNFNTNEIWVVNNLCKNRMRLDRFDKVAMCCVDIRCSNDYVFSGRSWTKGISAVPIRTIWKYSRAHRLIPMVDYRDARVF